MSPKDCSLAYDEDKLEVVARDEYEPELKVLVSKKYEDPDSIASEEIVKLGGRITVSF